MPSSSDQPNQFSLKRMFVVTALVAGLAWAWKFSFATGCIASYSAACFLGAATRGRKRSDPVVRGAFVGACVPIGLLFLGLTCLAFTDPSFVRIDAILSAIAFCAFIATYGALFGAAIGKLTELAISCWTNSERQSNLSRSDRPIRHQ